MDLKDWVKTAEDEKTVTMKHPKGHSMTIAIKALPKIQAEQIKRLKLADGGTVSADEPKPSAAGDSSPQQDTSDQGKVNININAAPTPAAAVPQPIAQTAAPKVPVPTSPVSQFADTPAIAQPPEPFKPPSVYNSNGTMNPNAINTTAKMTGDAQQDVDTAAAKAAVQIPEQQLKSYAEIAQQKQNDLSDLAKHTQELGIAVANGQIKPKNYLANAGTGEQIGNAIGLFLGGLSVPFGGHNYAFDFINKAIDRDIDAQKANFDQKRTLLGAYQHLYGEQVASEAAAKAGLWEVAKIKANQQQAQMGAPQAAINNAKFQLEATKRQKELLENAVDIRSLPGYQKVQGMGGQGGGGGMQGGHSSSESSSKMSTQQGKGSSGSWGDDQGSNTSTDRILTPEAQKKYDWAMSKYNHTMSDKEKELIVKEYQDGKQADKILGQIDELYPQLMEHRSYSGYLADKINPDTAGALLGAAGEGLGIAGAPVTGGASLLAGIPMAIAGGVLGKAGGSALKQGLRAYAGQDQTKYETAANSLESLVANALPGITPTERQSILKEFLPTKFDDDETAKDKVTKLKQKIISLTRTPTLDSVHVTRQGKN